VELSKDDLVEIKTNNATKPRSLQGTSIPNLLTNLQNEWEYKRAVRLN